MLYSKISSFLNKGNERTQNIKKNIVGSVIIKGVSIIIQLLLVPLTLGYLNSELYGIWLTLSSVILWLSFFDVGFTLGLKNRLAEAIALKKYDKGKALVSTTYFIMIIIFVPLGFILEGIVPYINWSSFLNVSSDYNEQLVQVVQVIVACFCLQMIFNVISSVLAAFQKVALSSLFPVIGNFLALIVIYILTKYTTSSLLNLALAISYLPVFVYIVSSIIFFKGTLKRVAPSFKHIDLSLVKEIFNLGIRFFIIQIQMIVLYQSTNILISNISSPIDVTSYNLAYKYISIALMLFNIILGPMWPAFTDAYTQKDYAWMNNIYRRMVQVYGVLCIAISIMVIASPWAYKLWLGDKILVPLPMTISVTLFVMAYAWNSLQTILINGIGCITVQTVVTVIGLVLHIPLSLFLGKYWGALGVVFSMIIINTIYSIIYTVQIKKILHKRADGIWIK